MCGLIPMAKRISTFRRITERSLLTARQSMKGISQEESLFISETFG